ncbi:Acyl dehydratase [Aromatoleum tolulyticum]|uniref:Acyl dehydratase n=1 Tax=Aromatoleum tolulyticum TaxID=34027 RepID=A0A1N6U3V5_9RHOO|nr:MaoC family dehydratase N-terminal domain-containing protein [Aromatoleum tolulyticum]SIQ60302.1 Acyl dehydratase [Aromatoleum tolulyticum]
MTHIQAGDATTGDAAGFAVCADADRLRRFAAAIGETTPLYVDEDAARRAGYRSLPLPPSFLFGLALEPGEPFPWFASVGLDLPRVLHGEQTFTYHAVPCAGDRLHVQPRISAIYDKPERGLRFVVRDIRITSELGAPVADLHSIFIQPDAARDPAPPKAAASAASSATAAEVREEPQSASVWHGELRLPPITRATLAQFATASGDLNPIHLDPEFACSVGFDDVFAQGMLSMAYLGRLLTSRVPQERLRQFRVRFTGRTLLGEAPVCTGTALQIDDSQAQRITLRVTNQAGEERLAGEAVVSAPR